VSAGVDVSEGDGAARWPRRQEHGGGTHGRARQQAKRERRNWTSRSKEEDDG
jgi:hypothetical protein